MNEASQHVINALRVGHHIPCGGRMPFTEISETMGFLLDYIFRVDFFDINDGSAVGPWLDLSFQFDCQNANDYVSVNNWIKNDDVREWELPTAERFVVNYAEFSHYTALVYSQVQLRYPQLSEVEASQAILQSSQ